MDNVIHTTSQRTALKYDDGFSAKLNRVATSTLLFICAFITSNLILNSIIAILSRSFKYTVIMTYNHVSSLPKDWHNWSRARIMAIYFTAPASCLLLGLLILIVLKANPERMNKLRLFAFWLMVCLVNIFLSNILFSPLGIRAERPSFYLTFAIVGTWLYLKQNVMTVFATGSIVASIIFGLMICKEILRFAVSGKHIKSVGGRNLHVLQLYVVPAILGCLGLALICTDQSLPPFTFVFFNFLFIAFGIVLMNIGRRIRVRENKKDVLNHTPYIEFFITAFAMLIIYRFFR